MPASQLKRLKDSLRDQGIIGPQQSKKQKKAIAKDGRARNEKRLQRGAALESIREQFNPFQFKTNARGPKFAVTTDKPDPKKGVLGRPGLAKALGEQRLKETLLVDMQRKNRVGGIFDRRIGEGDSTLTPEAAAAQRFALEKQKAYRKTSMFDLEDDEPVLTHGGKAFEFDDDGELKDDFNEEFSDDGSDMSDLEEHNRKRLKRLRDQVEANEQGDEKEPERKKSKKEVMEEVIAKSKYHKYERQAAKEDDEDLRLELDKETADIRSLLMGQRIKTNGEMPLNGTKDDSKPPVVAGLDRNALEMDYDLALRKMVQDKRAKPTMRTKTDEEIAEMEAERLRELEEKRLKRMRGEEVSDSEEDEDSEADAEDISDDKKPLFEIIRTDGEEVDFGLGKGIKARPTATELGLDDEDDFVIEDDLVASGSDIGDVDGADLTLSEDEGAAAEDDEDDEFTKGLLTESEAKDFIFNKETKLGDTNATDNGLPYTFPCPQNHAEFLELVRDIPLCKQPTVIQRIRALYHPKLRSEYKEKLGSFSRALVQHIAYLGTVSDDSLYPTLEDVIRHVHSLAKMFPVEIAQEFRSHIQDMEHQRPLALEVRDLYILTAIGSMFPTSDHFHQVATPAMLSMARYLGQKIPANLADYATGAYLCIQSLQYQKLAKRYVPEVMNFTLNSICALAPEKPKRKLGLFPIHEPRPAIRTSGAKKTAVRKLSCKDCRESKAELSGERKVALLSTNTSIIVAASETWAGKPAFFETFEPALRTLEYLTSKPNRPHLPDALLQDAEKAIARLSRALKVATLSRRPLELHHHKPLAIKTFIPKFEDGFDPEKHYDPDRERAESAKLRAEYKKEKKGEMRAIRKEASFLAREKLRAKKERDEAYEKKYKRIVADIQGEEGRAANEYEREKQKRKQSRNR
jgi:nucleolar protein 14